MNKEKILYRINKLNAKDPMVEEIISAIATEMDVIDEEAQQIINDMFFSTCSEEMLRFYEKEAGITPLPGQSIDGRRSSVEARWKSTGRVDVEQLQAVADSWKNGKVDVDFVGNEIQITFVDEYGTPADTDGLEKALDEIKPAHLPIVYFIRYLMLSDIESMALSELESHYLKDFAFG